MITPDDTEYGASAWAYARADELELAELIVRNSQDMALADEKIARRRVRALALDAARAIGRREAVDCRCVTIDASEGDGIDPRSCPEHAYEAGRRHERNAYLEERREASSEAHSKGWSEGQGTEHRRHVSLGLAFVAELVRMSGQTRLEEGDGVDREDLLRRDSVVDAALRFKRAIDAIPVSAPPTAPVATTKGNGDGAT